MPWVSHLISFLSFCLAGGQGPADPLLTGEPRTEAMGPRRGEGRGEPTWEWRAESAALDPWEAGVSAGLSPGEDNLGHSAVLPHSCAWHLSAAGPAVTSLVRAVMKNLLPSQTAPCDNLPTSAVWVFSEVPGVLPRPIDVCVR